jgi:hypothetical protein
LAGEVHHLLGAVGKAIEHVLCGVVGTCLEDGSARAEAAGRREGGRSYQKQL